MTKGAKIKAGSGLGLSAGAVIWLFATFALQRDMERVQKQQEEIRAMVLTLDAIRMNHQYTERQRYE